MTSKPSKDIFIAFGVLMLTIILSKEVNGASFIERQLACALDNGPCDKFGQEVKGKYHLKIFLLMIIFCLSLKLF